MIQTRVYKVAKENNSKGGFGTTIINNNISGGSLNNVEIAEIKSITADIIQANNATIKKLNASNIESENITSNNITSDMINSDAAEIFDLNSNNITSNSVVSESISGTNISAESANINSGEIVNATISNAEISNANVSTGTISTLNSDNAYLTNITSTSINNSGTIDTNELIALVADIAKLTSKDITVENLTVTKAAHFFKLIIDEIKASQGSVIITPANAVIDKVEVVNGNYRCYFRCEQDNKKIYNSFESGDQVICQTFNVATGTSYNVSNKFYWRLCTGTGSTKINDIEYHYVDLSDTDKDASTNGVPEAGDNIVMLGNRNDKQRQSAIVIAAYQNAYLDTTINTPYIAQYYGINNYNLASHRRSVISRDLNEFQGTFKTTSGKDIEEELSDTKSYVHIAYASSADGKTGFSKTYFTDATYMGICSNFKESDSDLIYSNYIWSRIRGVNGADGNTSYLHIAYANSADGSLNFSTTYFEGAKYIGTYTDFTKEGSTSYSKYTWSVFKGDKGDKGDNATIKSTSVTYALTSTSTQPADSAFTYTSIPSLITGYYLWIKTIVTYNDNTTVKSYNVSRIGTDGSDGIDGADGADGKTSYLHIAYANSADGRIGFSTTYFTGAKYIGTYTDFTKEDSTSYSDYTWAVLKGDKGDSITIKSTVIRYAVSKTSTQPADSAFTYTSIPDTISTGDYLWTKTTITYSDDNSVTTYSVSFISGEGAKGEPGEDAVYYKLIPIVEDVAVDKYSTLRIRLSYNIVKVEGTTYTTIAATEKQYRVKYRVNGEKKDKYLSYELQPTYVNWEYIKNYHKSDSKPQYVKVTLVDNFGKTKDQRIVPVIFDASATLEITDSITATVTGNKTDVDNQIKSVKNSISNVSLKADEISSTVSTHTTNINTINNSISSIKTDVSNISQKADEISTTVSSHTTSINSLNGKVDTNTTNISTLTQTAKEIKTSVSSNTTSISNLNTKVDKNMTSLTQTANEIKTTVSNHTTSINNLTGKVDTNTSNISSLTQTANEIKSNVSSNTTSLSNLTTKVDKNMSSLTQTANEIKTTVSNHTTSINNLTGKVNTNTSNISTITQKADEIELKVNEVSIKLNEGIELNGDTTVNGSVTINDNDTGFILKGNTGSTQIMANSIGYYNDFYNKSNTVQTTSGTSVSFVGQEISGFYQFNWTFTRSLGTVQSGKSVTFKTASISFMKPNSGTVMSGSNITFKVEIYEGSTVKITKTYNGSTSMTINNSFTSTGGEIKAKYTVGAKFSNTYWDTSSGGMQEMPGAKCNYSISWEYPNDNFQLIGYDGHGINFGNGSVVYLGPLMSVIKYGNYGLKVSTSGIERYVSSNLNYSTKSHKHGSSTYTDTLSSAYLTEWCPINGYAIRQTVNTSSGGNIYIDLMDDVIEVKNTGGMVNIFLGSPSYFKGKRVLIKKISSGGDMDIYAGYSTSNSSYRIIKGNTSSGEYNRNDNEQHCRAYFSDGTYWIEEWLSW